MTRDEAFSVLGLARSARLDEVRAAYRAAARAAHPDRPGAPADANAVMTRLNLAYEVLTGGDRSGDTRQPEPAVTDVAACPPQPASHRRHADDPTVHLDADGTLVVEAPAEEAFSLLAEAAELLGDLTYVDGAAGLLQLLVHRDDPASLASARPEPAAPWCYVTFSLQGRATGTEIFATIESIDGRPPIALQPLLELLAGCLTGQADGLADEAG